MAFHPELLGELEELSWQQAERQLGLCRNLASLAEILARKIDGQEVLEEKIKVLEKAVDGTYHYPGEIYPSLLLDLLKCYVARKSKLCLFRAKKLLKEFHKAWPACRQSALVEPIAVPVRSTRDLARTLEA